MLQQQHEVMIVSWLTTSAACFISARLDTAMPDEQGVFSTAVTNLDEILQAADVVSQLVTIILIC